MNPKEKLLVEAIRNLLSDSNDSLGLVFHKGTEETSHMAQFRHQDIENEFRVRANDPKMNLYEAVTAAFYHTHSYRNIDDPDFDQAFLKQMGDIVPESDKALALEILNNIRKDMGTNYMGGDIDDFDVVRNLDGIREVMGTSQQ